MRTYTYTYILIFALRILALRYLLYVYLHYVYLHYLYFQAWKQTSYDHRADAEDTDGEPREGLVGDGGRGQHGVGVVQRIVRDAQLRQVCVLRHCIIVGLRALHPVLDDPVRRGLRADPGLVEPP